MVAALSSADERVLLRWGCRQRVAGMNCFSRECVNHGRTSAWKKRVDDAHEESKRLNQAAVNVLAGLAARYLSLPLQLAISITIARALGPAGQGIYALAVTVAMTTILIGSLSVGAALPFYAARRREWQPTLAGLSVILSLGLGLVSGGLTAVICRLSPWRGGVLLWREGMLPGISALIVVMLLHAYTSSMLEGLQRVDLSSLTNVAYRALMLPVLFALALTSQARPRDVLNVLIVCFLASALLGTLFVNRLAGYGLRRTGEVGQQVLQFGLKIHPGNMAQALNLRLDLMVLSAVAPPASIGVYAVAVAVAQMLLQLPEAFASALYPRVAAANPREAARDTAFTARLAMAAVVAAAATLTLVSKPFLGVAYGVAYQAARTPLLLLLPGAMSLSLAQILTRYVAGVGRPDLAMRPPVLALPITVALTLLLIPRWHTLGAAAAWSLSQAAHAALCFRYYRGLSGSGLRQVVMPLRSDWKAYMQGIASLSAIRRGAPSGEEPRS